MSSLSHQFDICTSLSGGTMVYTSFLELTMYHACILFFSFIYSCSFWILMARQHANHGWLWIKTQMKLFFFYKNDKYGKKIGIYWDALVWVWLSGSQRFSVSTSKNTINQTNHLSFFIIDFFFNKLDKPHFLKEYVKFWFQVS